MYQIISDFNPSEADNQILSNALMAFNEKIFGEKVAPFSIFLKDEANAIRGGVIAYLQSDSIHIDIVWVDEALRRQRHGEKLLTAAEEEAIKYGCSFSTVNTMDFQAEGFYLKYGYERICEFKNYILGHTRIFLRKSLKSL
ncbi:TPA: GNAT family N-acetyltransferase [Legionella pneumophila]|nr:GNAT family N-acetyltransferase [Legionella pneumophila]HAU0297537.1 GNAT family N-acetyltransferase [Legionella pneumophila]